MRARLSHPIAACILCFAVAGCASPPRPAPAAAKTVTAAPVAAAPVPIDSAAREPKKPKIAHLRDVVEDLCTGFRFAGTAGELAAAESIQDDFLALGFKVELQRFAIGAGRRSQNVVALRPADQRPLLVIGAHYDSKAPLSPGAIDNASGVAAMLEAARCVQDLELNVKIAFVAFGAEERLTKGAGHHHGSRHYAQRLLKRVKKNEIVGMINVDMACGEKLYIGSMRIANQGLLKVVQDIAVTQGLTFVDEKEKAASDHEAFERRGIPVAYIHYWPAKDGAYHNAKDRPELVDYDQVRAVATLLVDSIIAIDQRSR